MLGNKKVCPDCGGPIQVDDDGKTGVCTRCGQKIKLTKKGILSFGFGPNGLGFSYSSSSSSGQDEAEDTEDVPFRSTFTPSGKSLSEALGYWNGTAGVMSKEEAKESYGTIVEEVAGSLFSDIDENVPVDQIMRLSEVMDGKFDGSDGEGYSDFYIAVCNKALEDLSGLTDSPNFPHHISGFMILSMVVGGRYTSIKHQRDIFSSMSDNLRDIVGEMDVALFDDDETPRGESEIWECINFLDMIVSKIDSELRSYSEPDLDRLADYWRTESMSESMNCLLDAREADYNANNSGLFGSSKFKNQRKESLSAYLDAYFEPLKKGYC